MDDVRRTRTMRRAERQQMKHARQLLEYAAGDLGDSQRMDSDLQSFREFLGHDEFELALQELERLGELRNAAKGFWLWLSMAANQIGGVDRAKRYERFLEDPAG